MLTPVHVIIITLLSMHPVYNYQYIPRDATDAEPGDKISSSNNFAVMFLAVNFVLSGDV